MKFVIYKGQQKITIENALVPDMQNFERLMDDMTLQNSMMADMLLHNIQITSMRGISPEDMEFVNEEVEKEIFYGINWTKETVN